MEPIPESNEVEKTVFTKPEVIFAWVCLALGYLFCRTVPLMWNPMGGFLFILALYAFSGVLLAVKKVKLSGTVIAASCASIALSLAPVVAESAFLATLAFLFAIFSYCYAMSAAFGNALEAGASNCLFLDYFQAVFLMPYFSIVQLFRALFQGKGKPILVLLLKIFSGILIAVVPALLIFALLSYDAGFSNMMEDIFELPTEELESHLRCIFWGIPLAMYLFGLYVSASQNKKWNTLTPQSARSGMKKVRILPKITVVCAVLPVLFLYAVFFLSQWQYYISGFTGVLPEGFSYAQYAREGFFQLCAVSVINLVILLNVTLFTRRKREKPELVVQLISVVLCLFTLILISTAIAKLVLYIDSYGLTHKRIYSMWLMAVIGIVYLVITVGQFVPKLKTVFVSACVCVVLFGALSLCNVSRITADYNAARYLDGSLESVDVALMEELGDSAVPAMVQLADTLKEETAPEKQALFTKLDELLQDKTAMLEEKDRSLFAFTIPGWQAEEALKKYGK